MQNVPKDILLIPMDGISYLQALDHIRNIKPVFSKRTLPIEEACGWVLAEPLFARFNVPPAPSADTDGFAVTAAATAKATEAKPVTLKEFEPVKPGIVIKKPFDTVIAKEDVFSYTSDKLVLTAPATPGSHTHPAGEEMQKGRLILPAGAKLRAFDIGVLACYGHAKVPVKSVSVGIIPVGDSMVKAGAVPKPGQTVESNAPMAEAYVRQFGIPVIRYPAVEQDRAKIKKALAKAIKENDLVIISASPSMDTPDVTAEAIGILGKLVFQNVLMKPANNSLLGNIKGKPVIGIPGFPIAGATALRMFVRPLLELWGFAGPTRTKLTATAGSLIETDENIDELRFGATAFVEGKPVALPEARTANVLMDSIRANGYLHVPRGMKSVEAGNVIKAVTDADATELKDTILIGGIYSLGMETFVENAAEAGLIVRFGEGDPLELLKNKSCHAVCSDTKLKLNVPLETFDLCDGTYLIMRTDMNDSLCGCLRRFAGII